MRMTSRGAMAGVGILLVLTWATGLALADGFRNPPESASALGRIGANVAQIGDPSAATINPANMTEMQGTSVMASVTMGYARREFESVYGPKVKSESPWACLPSAFAVCPLDGGQWTMGLGLTVPYGRFSDWGNDVFFGAASPYYAEQRVINFNPSLARRIGNNLSVAVGASVYQSDLSFKQSFPWSVLTGDAATPAGDAEFAGDGFGYGANAAATWRIDERNTLALTVKAPFDIEYKGDFKVSNVPGAAAAMGVTAESDFETEVKYPTVVALGYGIRLSDNLRAELDVEWVEHSRNQYLPLDIGNNNVLLSTTRIPQDWSDTITVGIGIDWAFSPNWIARAGCMYIPTPTVTETTLPVASEEDQEVVSCGLGYRRGVHNIDLAYSVGLFDGLKVDDNVVPAVNGTYDFEAHIISLAYTCRL